MESQTDSFQIASAINEYALSKTDVEIIISSVRTQLLNDLNHPTVGAALHCLVLPVGRYTMQTAFVDDELDFLLVCVSTGNDTQNQVVELLGHSRVFHYLDPKEDGHRFLAPEWNLPGTFSSLPQIRVRILCLTKILHHESASLIAIPLLTLL